MRSDFCMVMLALCLFALECTADDGDVELQLTDVKSADVVTTTTTAAAQIISVPADNPGGEEERTVTESEVQHNSAKEEEKKEEKKEEGDGSDVAAAKKTTTVPGNQQRDQDTSQPEVKTTTTTTQVTSVQAPNSLKREGERESEVRREDTIADGENGRTTDGQTVSEATGALVPGVKSSLKRDIKTNTSTAAVQTPPETENGTIKEKDTLNQDRAVPGSEVKGTEVGTTTTTNALLTGHKDVSAGQRTTPPVTKTERGSDQTPITTGNATGGAKGKKGSAVTSPTTPFQKTKETDSEIPQTGNSGEKETVTMQTLKSTTTTTAEQTASSDTSTTSLVSPTKLLSVASTATLPKGFNISQSLGKTDGSSGITLLFAFVTLVTFSVMAVAPVY